MKNIPVKSSLDNSQRIAVFWALLLLLILTGIYFRSAGYFNESISLWHDEASWARKIIHKPLLSTVVIRPIGYMVVSKWILSIANNEITLRIISYAAAIISIFLFYMIAREVFNSKLVILLAVFTFCINPI